MSADEKLDARILAALAKDSGTLLELAIRLETDTTTLQRRLQVLGTLKRVQCGREDGRFLWSLTDEEADAAADAAGQGPVHVEQPAPERPEHSAPDVPAPAPSPSASLTDRLEAYVAEHGPVTPAQAVAAFPDAKASSVYSLLSQLVAAKRLIGEKPPGGGFKRYRVRGKDEPAQAPLPPPPAPRPAPAVETPAPAPARAAAPDPQPRLGSGMVLTMQDADFASLLKIGTVVISNDPKAGVQITIAGFEFGAAGTCREHAARALLWARELINTALSAQLLVPGGTSRIVVGVD